MTDSWPAVADGAVDRAVDRDADAFSRRRAASGNSCPELTPVGWATRRSVPGVATLAGRPVRRAHNPLHLPPYGLDSVAHIRGLVWLNPAVWQDSFIFAWVMCIGGLCAQSLSTLLPSFHAAHGRPTPQPSLDPA